MKHGSLNMKQLTDPLSQKSVFKLASGACLITGLILSGLVTASPWHEKAISQHIHRSEFSGQLGASEFEALRSSGEHLFSAQFTVHDGVGRPMATQAIIPTKRKRPPRSEFARMAGLDANACSSCHNQPVSGGAGDFSVNVFVSEGFTQADFDSSDPQFSNERNTNHLFGAGLVELLAREMTADLHQQRHEALLEAHRTSSDVRKTLVSKGVEFGFLIATPDGLIDTHRLSGVDDDLIIKPFSQKGVITSLRQFTVNALNHHHGMQATERFGSRWTGTPDFDEDGMSGEITAGDVSALVAYQASLPVPASKPVEGEWLEASNRGSALFDELQCSSCHVRALPLESLHFSDPGPLDTAGTLRQSEAGADAIYDLELLASVRQLEKNSEGHWMVPLFGDLKRHVITDNRNNHFGNELLSQRFVERNEFMTSELWGIASTAPYGHRGDLTTMAEAIEAHGGDAKNSRDQFAALSDASKGDVIAFLKTLIISE